MIEETRKEPLPPNFPDGNRGRKLSPSSDEAKELAKFEQWPTPWAPKPGNPYKYRPFPKMVYRAAKWMGKIACHAVVGPGWEFKSAEERRIKEASAEDFTKSCQRIVENEEQLQKAYEEGYRGDPLEAENFLQAREKAISTGAAERHYSDERMSEKAQREAAAADAETAEHLPAIPEKPLSPKKYKLVMRRRGRPKGSKNKPKR